MIFLLTVVLSASGPDVRPLSQETVCATTWGTDSRHVSESMRKAVFARDGIPWADRAHYIVDHRVPRELAGADVLVNLQIQTIEEAHQKDVVENRLHRWVCGEYAGVLPPMTLAEAQERIRKNWRTALVIQVKQ